MKLIFPWLLSITFIFSSCHTNFEITKRKYRPGLFMDISISRKIPVQDNSTNEKGKEKLHLNNIEKVIIPTLLENKNLLTTERNICKPTEILVASNEKKIKTQWIKRMNLKQIFVPDLALQYFTKNNSQTAPAPPSAIISFVFAIISLLAFSLLVLPDIYFGLVFPISILMAFIFSRIALKKINSNPELKGKGIAKFAFIMSLIGFGIIIIGSILILSSI